MDIKDFILIGGGLLIAAVVVHGFWIAWKARRDPLRMDLVSNLPETGDEDDLKRLRAELPNGGARVVDPEAGGPAEEAGPAAEPGHGKQPSQGHLELDRQSFPARSARPDAADLPQPTAASRKTEPRLDPLPEPPRKASARQARDHDPEPAEAPADPAAGKVRDVILPERSGKSGLAREPRRWPGKKPSEPPPEPRSAGRTRSAGVQPPAEPRKAEPPVEELIVLNVMSPRGRPFKGPGVVEALRARGLRYGDMNIFHRVDPMTRASLYSVANVVEPGTFDLADLEHFRSPGVCLFMQLPGPEQPLEVFEDMLKAAREVAVRVGGEVKDEQRSVMTGQTVEHYRQRISDYCRRRMSMRA